jgi:hypothetical protein
VDVFCISQRCDTRGVGWWEVGEKGPDFTAVPPPLTAFAKAVK